MAGRYDFKIVLCLWRLAIHPIYRAIFIILVLVNTFYLTKVPNDHDKNLSVEQ